jgi:DNA-binding CsgD family transcriptional regulator
MAAERGNELPLHRATPAELKARLEAERGGEPFLLFFDDAGCQRILALDAVAQARVTVGRGATDVRLDWDSDVSRLHAELEHLGGCWTVADDGLSRNGTYLNGARVRGRSRLAELDRLRFGTTTVIYRSPPRPSLGDSVVRTTLGTEPVEIGISAAQRRVLIALARPFAAQGSFATPATNREIAAELHVSVDTVKTHLRAIATKFDIGDLPQNAKRARLVELALQSGEISEHDLEP